MISTNIDGTSGSSNQLFDLLTVVANPKEYQSKIQALEDAIAENKKYVDLVGPASDILALKEKAKADADKAAKALKDAEQKAGDIVAGAEARADVIISSAQERADSIAEKAQALMSEARSAKALADSAAAQAAQTQSRAEAAIASAAAKSEQLDEALEKAKQAKEDLASARADLIAKHQAFIKSL
jgi:cell division septum initiation protein DivIVA